MDWQGRHVFVAGGGSGIGQGIARAFARAGARVAIGDVDAQRAAAAADAIGPDAMGLPLDVADRTQWDAALDAAEARFGPIDLLCNSAGILGGLRSLPDIPADRVARLFDITLMGVVHGVQSAVPRLRGRGGQLLFVSSMGGVSPVPTLADYCTAKAGLVALADCLAVELAPDAIDVSVVLPGLVATRLRESTAALLGEEHGPSTGAAVASGAISPDEVGRIVLAGLAAGQRYIFTHPERRADVARRSEAILAGFDWLDGFMDRTG